MVFSGDAEGGVRDLAMAIGPERTKPPLHNFNLPCLKWGNQKHLRCLKVTESAAFGDTNRANGTSADRIRATRSPPSRFAAARDYEVRRYKKLKLNGAGAAEEGIEAVGEEIMCEIKAAADELKATILRGVSEGSDGRAATWYQREQEEDSDAKEKSQSAAAAEEEARPWNLRTRRAACKAPVGGNSVKGKALRIEEPRASDRSPARSDGCSKSPSLLRCGKEKETEQPRPDFSVALSKKEIEEDFMAMLGHRPPRRPKKRPRNVQRQLDMLFPGLWLTEVTADSYKVPEQPEKGKR